jgi:hypothetical protein
MQAQSHIHACMVNCQWKNLHLPNLLPFHPSGVHMQTCIQLPYQFFIMKWVPTKPPLIHYYSTQLTLLGATEAKETAFNFTFGTDE